MLSSHTLADDLGVLVDEDERLGLAGVDSASSGNSKERVGSGEPGGNHGSSRQHLSFFIINNL